MILMCILIGGKMLDQKNSIKRNKISYSQGDILFINLNPIKGHEQGKNRPCVIVSNDYYNQKFNTVIVAPISSAEKYKSNYYLESDLFIRVPDNPFIYGTILLQHLRAIDLQTRAQSEVLFKLPPRCTDLIRSSVRNFF